MLRGIRKRSYYTNYRNHFATNDFLSNFFSDGADYTVPAVNVKENENSFELEIAAPGLSKNDFEVKIEKDILTVSSKTESEKESANDNFKRREFYFKEFSRSFSIPESVDQEKIKASHKNGVLHIELPLMEKAKLNQSRTIKIS